MEAFDSMSFEPRISRMGTDTQKAMLARPLPWLGGPLQRPLQASLRRPFQTPSSIRFANDQHLACGRDRRSEIGDRRSEGAERFLEQWGLSRSDRAMCFWKSRTSELGKGFKNSAPAWLAKRSSTAASPSVLICAIRG